MVTSYYIMKMSQNKFDAISYYSKINESPVKKNTDYDCCRICLQQGIISIYENEDSSEILEAISIFAGFEVTENDEFSKHLCRFCYNFLQGAILFRKTAKKSAEVYNLPVKEEIILNQNQDQIETDNSTQNYTDCYNYDSKQDWSPENDIQDKSTKKLKQATKVTCHICNKVVNRSYFKEHLTMHDPNHLKYVCDVCGKSFRLRCAYHNHSLRHRDDFPFKCQFCPYRGRYAELLKTHMRTHTGDYRYMCTECPARFLFKSNLNSHMLKHKEPQFKCNACKRAFHTEQMLQRHYEADHLGIKNHVCNMCGKAFGYRNAMMKHQRHVHKREKFLFGRMPSYLEAEQKHQEDG
ncbi:PREDICTED: zinc finger protein 33A-like [Papilio xuthus]|uniref:Zinc finger protein 33A-like n=1 Tax=Papilio xuthus TaxID=66420 RepID=A0AAJ7E740_PAPXU|nr:PREDICTED: zinc finger protein 33A-like [Papilio xuthus]